MQDKPLSNKIVAVMAANGFAEAEMAEIQRLFVQNGARVKTVSTENGLVSGWSNEGWGLNFPVEQGVSTCLSSDFDMFVVVGGTRSVDKLKASPHMKRILRGCMENQTPLLLLNEAVSVLDLVELPQATQIAKVAQASSGIQNATEVEQRVVVSGSIITGVVDEQGNEAIVQAMDFLGNQQQGNNAQKIAA